MSNTNYDVELPIYYSSAYKHYIPTYQVIVPQYLQRTFGYSVYHQFNAYISFDSNGETELGYAAREEEVSPPYWNTKCTDIYNSILGISGGLGIPDSGVFSKCYLRNPRRSAVSFNTGNCSINAIYGSKAPFEIQWNSVGFAANQNATFRCSTIPKNTPAQYEWTAATVYYKESTASTYSSVAGTVSGTWSDVTISTNLSLNDGVTYNIYIRATADDGSVANTPVGEFNTVDAVAVAACIAPSGAFTNGDINFVWSHNTAYGTPQYAYDLQYSNNNGGTWTTLKSHEVTENTSTSTTLTEAGVYIWRVRTYNSNDVVGEWAEASFVNNGDAVPPSNIIVNTSGRPTVEWTSSSQSAYQVQLLLGDSIVYDSGAVYTSEMRHFVNQYFNDNRAYIVRVRVYNALGEVSSWTTTGYQQPSVSDVEFTINPAEDGGAVIVISPNNVFTKYYILRNDKPIAMITGTEYVDKYAIGLNNYGVIGVTSEDQSDIQVSGFRVNYPCATLVTLDKQMIRINKRVNEAYEIQTSNESEINKVKYIGNNLPTHYPSKMRLKSFAINCFDDQAIFEDLLGTMVYYADNFGNGGWCMVTSYSKTDNYVQNGQGIYANEVSLQLEVTNYDDSIEYEI